ncbi:hypothetical protein ABW20_dc0100009 [Dactylellina cionopaga]|nr:hypothetical protein ABW20_dc0100009 [Dactylellina cionopaga]
MRIGPSKVLGSYFDLPKKAPRTRSDFQIYSDAQLHAAKTLRSKEIIASNQIKLCVGIDDSVTESLRLSKEGGELNRRLLRDREEYAVRHSQVEAAARDVYNGVGIEAIELLQTATFRSLWPFILVFSCYEFTSHRRNFQHGHCLYLMVTVTSKSAWNSAQVLHGLLSDLVRTKGGEGLLLVVIQEVSRCGQVNDGPPRLLESSRGRYLPRNLDYHVRPPMGSSVGPTSSGTSGTIGGYVTTQTGAVYAVTASHAVGEPFELVVSPSTVDLAGCYRQAQAKEELALQELDINLRSIGSAKKETLDSRRRWEIAQEELLVFSDFGKRASPLVSQLGVVSTKTQGAFYASHEGAITKTHLDLALIECLSPRIGFNTIPCVQPNSSTVVIEVNTARSPLPGEPVLKNGLRAVLGYFEKEIVTLRDGSTTEVQPRIIQNWCITSRRRRGIDDDVIFAAPGDSGAWILAEPSMPSENDHGGIVTTHTPVLGAIMHEFLSVEGIDLIMFQPWEIMAEGFKQLLGEECVPLLPLSNQIALLREQQINSDGCGVCLRESSVGHYMDQCPERFRAEDNRSFFVKGENGVRRLYDPEPLIKRRRLSRIPTGVPRFDEPEPRSNHSDEESEEDLYTL